MFLKLPLTALRRGRRTHNEACSSLLSSALGKRGIRLFPLVWNQEISRNSWLHFCGHKQNRRHKSGVGPSVGILVDWHKAQHLYIEASGAPGSKGRVAVKGETELEMQKLCLTWIQLLIDLERWDKSALQLHLSTCKMDIVHPFE